MKSDNMLASGRNHTREPEEFYATHPSALEIALPALDKIGLSSKVWECACGQGHLSEVLKANGRHVYSTDIVDRGYGDGVVDFLQHTDTWEGDILTNPPFKLAQAFVEKAMSILPTGNKAIFFLKIQFLESKDRLKLFKNYPPKYVIVNSERQQTARNAEFDKYTTKTLCFCWFVFEKGFCGNPQIVWI